MTAAGIRSSVAGALGLGFTIAVAVAPSALLDHGAPGLKTIIATAVVLVGTLVALLAFGRFRRSGSLGDLSIACAVMLLAWVHVLFGTVPDLISPNSVGSGVSERIESWGMVVVRLVAASLLISAVRSSPPMGFGVPVMRHRYLHLLAPAAVGVAAIAVLVGTAPISRTDVSSQISLSPSVVSILQSIGALLFFVAFLRLSTQAGTRSDPFLGWIAAGSVFAGFAMINYALHPAGRPDWLPSGDLLQAAAVCTWAMGAVSEILSYWSRIAESTRRETRRSVALDLHDGLAQELALLTMYTHASADARAQPEWHEHLQMTAERALAEARRAIAALAADEPVPFETDLERTAESISGSGVDIRVEVGADSSVTTTDPLQRESIVRIVREAVTNAVRHGGASHIDILFEAGRSPVLRVFDDGVGFDPTLLGNPGRFGLLGMRERAEAIGASLAIRSAPGQGTTVEVLWP